MEESLGWMVVLHEGKEEGGGTATIHTVSSKPVGGLVSKACPTDPALDGGRTKIFLNLYIY